jgi:predicted TIM-barrel fold metal-dependent hydrolase
MWSNDYPHQNSTWPNSRAVIERDMGHLPEVDRDKLLNANVRKLYNLKAPASLPIAA